MDSLLWASGQHIIEEDMVETTVHSTGQDAEKVNETRATGSLSLSLLIPVFHAFEMELDVLV